VIKFGVVCEGVFLDYLTSHEELKFLVVLVLVFVLGLVFPGESTL
jgi:hypothetical protein